jgi:outer membrane protein assembly factor BamD
VSAARRRGTRRPAALVALGLLAACHHFSVRSYVDPVSLLQASLRQFRAGRYDRAQEGFQKLTFDLAASDTLYPVARYYLGESYFGQGDYLTAAREFRRVADESPNSRLAPQALLRVGDCYGALWTKPELDPTNGQTALATYHELQGRFPGAEATRIAGVRIRALNEQFARKEFENALFYYKHSAYDSAILYFKDLIASYPSTSLVPDAFVYIVRSFHAIGYADEENDYCGRLRQLYPHHAGVRQYCGDGTAGR